MVKSLSKKTKLILTVN